MDLDEVVKRIRENHGAGYTEDIALELVDEVEHLRNEIKGLRNDEDFDPSPIITEYDRVVAEVEELNQEILRLRAGHVDLAAMHAKAVMELDQFRPKPRTRLGERRVIEAARAWRDWRREWITTQVDWSDEYVQPVIHNLVRAIDALTHEANDEDR